MKKSLILVFTFLLIGSPVLLAQMTDVQVEEYVKGAVSAGKTQDQVVTELIARGVTREQAERLRSKYEGMTTEVSTDPLVVTSPGLRQQQTADVAGGAGAIRAVSGMAVPETESPAPADHSGIYGHNIFNSKTLSFEPNINSATPDNYKLGPGDELIIDIWGNNEASIVGTISPEGRISISQIGPIQLSGLTIKQAKERITKKLEAKYAGIVGSESDVSVTLGNIRTIQVNVMGEVNVPGTYRLSSLSTVFNALYRAGGVTDVGSMRAIKVVRGGKTIATVDVYGYLLEGKSDSDINLQEDDIIIVPTYSKLVKVSGNVKRPMRYEMNGPETVSTLLKYCGGFASDAYSADITLIRNTGEEKSVFTINDKQYDSYKLEDGDEIVVGAMLDRFSNMVTVNGFVFRPGMYELGGSIATVRQLVERAGGLKEDAFTERAVLLREKEDLSYENISLNIGGIMAGTASDVLLKKNDIITVSGKYDMEDRGTLTIKGMVEMPGDFIYSDNTTPEDLIVRAGGLLRNASLARMDVYRMEIDEMAMKTKDTLAKVFTFPIKEGLVVGAEGFMLQPYDVVVVRRSPGFNISQNVTLSGEFNFPGDYVLLREGERVSSLVKRAGGLTSTAYPRGARLIRQMSDTEILMNEVLAEKARNSSGRDTLSVSKVMIDENYHVSFDLEDAINNPGSEYDIILNEGDMLIVPKQTSIVHVTGEVMFPNTVAFKKGRNVKSYINGAGGFTLEAKKNKVYIVYTNGSAMKTSGRSLDIEPGCTIVVPTKPENKRVSVQEIAAIAQMSTSVASLASVLFGVFTKL